MFKGWKDASGNTVTKDTIVNDNLKLTAEWEIKKYTLTVKPMVEFGIIKQKTKQ